MMDVYMAATLAAAFVVFYGFTAWCGHVIEDKGEDSR